MNMQQYLAIQAFSSGLAHTILAQSPLHAWIQSPWNPRRPQDHAQDADIGTYAHAMLLEGGHDSLAVIEADDFRTKDAREARDEARAAGKLPILEHKVGDVEQMVETAERYIADTELAGLFEHGAAEQTVLFNKYDVHCKARPDYMTDKICLSYKTTAASAAADDWIRRQLPGYDMGIAFYQWATGLPVITLVQEQSAPFACCLVALSPAYTELAESKLRRAMSIWKDCMARNHWPAYPSQICYADPASWMLAREEAQP